ncbi:hypothetical protein BH23ACT3_BH23ACT3_00680 [soil metagenome]
MRGIVHPFSKALYEVDHDGNIRVTAGDRVGTFDLHGRWITGELRECDPQLCGWIGGPQVANHRLDSSS